MSPLIVQSSQVVFQTREISQKVLEELTLPGCVCCQPRRPWFKVPSIPQEHGELLRYHTLPCLKFLIASWWNDQGLVDLSKIFFICYTTGNIRITWQSQHLQDLREEKQRASLGGRFIEFFPWKDHSKDRVISARSEYDLYEVYLETFLGRGICSRLPTLGYDATI